ncbi:MAG TPA: hypothetical protein VM597_27690 [Gemmataceae bacterium]|nr:hypothetical protein [Gemmataceae bacterium]
MAGRRRTIDRKAQRTDYDEEGAPKAEDEEAEDEEEEEDEDEDEGEEGEADADAVDADDDSGDDDDDGGDDDDDEDAPKKKKKKVAKPKKAAAPKRARATKKAVRQKAVWVVLDNSSKQVETFPYAEKAEAEKYVADRAEDKKGYYLQMMKVPLEDK